MSKVSSVGFCAEMICLGFHSVSVSPNKQLYYAVFNSESRLHFKVSFEKVKDKCRPVLGILM